MYTGLGQASAVAAQLEESVAAYNDTVAQIRQYGVVYAPIDKYTLVPWGDSYQLRFHVYATTGEQDVTAAEFQSNWLAAVQGILANLKRSGTPAELAATYAPYGVTITPAPPIAVTPVYTPPQTPPELPPGWHTEPPPAGTDGAPPPQGGGTPGTWEEQTKATSPLVLILLGLVGLALLRK